MSAPTLDGTETYEQWCARTRPDWWKGHWEPDRFHFEMERAERRAEAKGNMEYDSWLRP